MNRLHQTRRVVSDGGGVHLCACLIGCSSPIADLRVRFAEIAANARANPDQLLPPREQQQ
jgi:hypothetical protein